VMRPEIGAGSSTVTLSVSIMTTASSWATVSPSPFSHSPICTSVIDSPTAGTLSSTANCLTPYSSRTNPVIRRHRAAETRQPHLRREVACLPLRHSERSINQLLLLEPMTARRTGCRACGDRSRDLRQWEPAEDALTEVHVHVHPS